MSIQLLINKFVWYLPGLELLLEEFFLAKNNAYIFIN